MIFTILAGLFGGLGLFLIGMRLMTNGLRHAAGNALRNILGKWTKTPLRGIVTGFMVTALVQSSSAITVAVIGFVNAGLISMAQSVGVIFGSNIGTTVTSWIVAAVGINVNIKALALPLIGIGAILRLTGGQTRRTHLGDALTGFGLFFLGIEILQTTFNDLQSVVDLSAFDIAGIPGLLMFVGVGAVLTLLMQSSSAAMALILTAAMSGIVSLNNAAAAAIGTNIGTTSTALLSVIGATANAKKVAAAHIIFNLGTGIAALMALPLLIKGIVWLAALDGATDLPTILALFHTIFNLLGVLIFLPFTRKLVDFLDRNIGYAEAQMGKPHFLDQNVLRTPTLAMDALFMELGRLGDMTRETCRKGIADRFRDKDFVRERAAIETLVVSIKQYCVEIQRLDLPEDVAVKMPAALRVVQYYRRAIALMTEISQQHGLLDHGLPDDTAHVATLFRREARHILEIADHPCVDEFTELKRLLDELTDSYHDLKDELLRAGADNRVELDRMVNLHEYYSLTRRMCEQSIKGTIYWSMLRNKELTCPESRG